MSQAFVRENDEQWLHEISPTLQALVLFLTRENNGIRVYEKKTFLDEKTGVQVHEMSNGFRYTKGADGKWMMV